MSRDLHALAAREGFDLVAEHVDNGIIGAVRDRPEFGEWLDDARDGRAEVLLTWSVDRLTREGLPVAALILDVVEGRDPAGKPSHKPVRLLDFHGLDSRHGESFPPAVRPAGRACPRGARAHVDSLAGSRRPAAPRWPMGRWLRPLRIPRGRRPRRRQDAGPRRA